MELRFKEEEESKAQSGEMQQAGSSFMENWSPEGELYQTVTINHTNIETGEAKKNQKSLALSAVGTIIILFIVGLIVIGIGKAIVSVVMPEGEDITPFLTGNADSIAAELGVTFTDHPEWVSRVHQYGVGTVTVKAAEDIGIVYLNGRQIGVQVESKAYTMFGIQIGDGEKHAYDHMTYSFEDFFSVINDMAEGKTTTYFYYNKKQNDCIALTINDTTNRIVGMTYFTDYQKIIQTLDFY